MEAVPIVNRLMDELEGAVVPPAGGDDLGKAGLVSETSPMDCGPQGSSHTRVLRRRLTPVGGMDEASDVCSTGITDDYQELEVPLHHLLLEPCLQHVPHVGWHGCHLLVCAALLMTLSLQLVCRAQCCQVRLQEEAQPGFPLAEVMEGKGKKSRTSSRRGSTSSTASTSGLTDRTKSLMQESSALGKALDAAAAAKKKQSKVSQFLLAPGSGKGPATAPTVRQDFRAHRTSATGAGESTATTATAEAPTGSSWADESEKAAREAEATTDARIAALAAAATAPEGSATAAVAAVVLAATSGSQAGGGASAGDGEDALSKQTELFLKEARDNSNKLDEDFITVQRRKPGHRPRDAREVREIGSTLTDRSRRGETPFKDAGAKKNPGYFTSSYKEAQDARLRRNAREPRPRRGEGDPARCLW